MRATLVAFALVVCSHALHAQTVTRGNVVLPELGSSRFVVDARNNAARVTAQGDAPTIDEMRRMVVRMQQRLKATGKAPTMGVSLSYPVSNRTALSTFDGIAKRFVTTVTDGFTFVMFEDEFELSANPVAKAETFGPGTTMYATRIVCSGWVKNQKKVRAKVSVRCEIVDVHTPGFGSTKGSKAVTKVAAAKTHEVGILGPGKKKRYRFRVDKTKHKVPSTVMVPFGFQYRGIQYAQRILVDGRKAEIFNGAAMRQAREWLELTEKQRKRGFRVKLSAEYGAGQSLQYEVPAGWLKLPLGKRKASTKVLWRELSRHYKKHFPGAFFMVFLRSNGAVAGQIANGKYKP